MCSGGMHDVWAGKGNNYAWQQQELRPTAPKGGCKICHRKRDSMDPHKKTGPLMWGN